MDKVPTEILHKNTFVFEILQVVLEWSKFLLGHHLEHLYIFVHGQDGIFLALEL